MWDSIGVIQRLCISWRKPLTLAAATIVSSVNVMVSITNFFRTGKKKINTSFEAVTLNLATEFMSDSSSSSDGGYKICTKKIQVWKNWRTLFSEASIKRIGQFRNSLRLQLAPETFWNWFKKALNWHQNRILCVWQMANIRMCLSTKITMDSQELYKKYRYEHLCKRVL